MKEYKSQILDSMRAGRQVFEPPNFGYFYPVGGDELVAKVFLSLGSGIDARREFDNLEMIFRINDDRLRVPQPHDIVELGGYVELVNEYDLLGYALPPDYPNEPIYGVVMEWVHGPNITKLGGWLKRRQYRKPLRELIDNMLEHGVYKSDLKAEEIICIPDQKAVCVVDMHMLGDTRTQHLEKRYKKIQDYL